MDEITLKDIGSGKGVKLNYTKLAEHVKRCREEEDSRECRRELENMGITWID